MNLIDAIKKAREKKCGIWRPWPEEEDGLFCSYDYVKEDAEDRPPFNIDFDDVLFDGWKLKEKSITITESKFDEIFDDVSRGGEGPLKEELKQKLFGGE